MYRLLIVDDEYYERLGLQRQLDWDQYGITTVDLAENGAVACRKFEEAPYDIVITDVSMPIMDGLVMAKKMKELRPETKFLFISGYDDFQYVKQAMQVHAYDYLLKPIGDELGIKVQEIVSEMNRIRGLRAAQVQQREKLILREELLGQEVLRHYVHQNWPSFWNILNQLDFHNASVWVWIRGETGSPAAVGARSGYGIREDCQKFSKNMLVGRNGYRILCLLACEDQVSLPALQAMIQRWEQLLDREAREKWKFSLGIFPRTPDRKTQAMKWLEQEDEDSIRTSDYSYVTKQLLDIVRKRYMEDIALKRIARELELTPNYLSAVFKREVGQGFYEFLTDYRMKQAARMLREENSRVYQIANAVGYHDTVAFIKKFRGTYDCTPSQYRNRCAQMGESHDENR